MCLLLGKFGIWCTDCQSSLNLSVLRAQCRCAFSVCFIPFAVLCLRGESSVVSVTYRMLVAISMFYAEKMLEWNFLVLYKKEVLSAWFGAVVRPHSMNLALSHRATCLQPPMA